jgi:hypothetical protein
VNHLFTRDGCRRGEPGKDLVGRTPGRIEDIVADTLHVADAERAEDGPERVIARIVSWRQKLGENEIQVCLIQFYSP